MAIFNSYFDITREEVAVVAGAPGGLFGDAGVAQCGLRKLGQSTHFHTAKGSEDRSDSIVVGFVVNS